MFNQYLPWSIKDLERVLEDSYIKKEYLEFSNNSANH